MSVLVSCCVNTALDTRHLPVAHTHTGHTTQCHTALTGPDYWDILIYRELELEGKQQPVASAVPV